MKATKIGIWMDHAHAHLTEFTDPMVTTVIASRFSHGEKEKSLHKSEGHMHVKEQHGQAEYYKVLAEVIRKYKEVILFGPTDAKVELLNTLSGNALLASVKIQVKDSDKMSTPQEQAFVRKHFLGK